MENKNRDPQKSITGAIILILIGVVFLVKRLNLIEIQNWWALFILIPAISSLSNLIQDLRRGISMTAVIAQGILGAIFPAAIAAMLLFNLSWEKFWPIFIILAGFSLLLTGFLPAGKGLESLIQTIQPWLISSGLAVILTGSLFFVQTINFFNINKFVPNWWGLPILVAAMGGVIAAYFSFKADKKTKTGINLLAALILSIPGFFAILGIQANLVFPLLIIAIGMVLIITFINQK
ncbi:MAG: hypothetical protein CL609_05170 [Anaerolineaceae bacterium]|nr:hypothetical protein [Anaerolineaceae bacterium]